MTQRKGAQRGGRPRRKKAEVFSFEGLKWDSASNARRSLAALMAAFARGEVAEGKLRVLTYTARALLPFWEFERDCQLDKRLDELEKRVAELLAGKGAE